jgi:hypothetical protein
LRRFCDPAPVPANESYSTKMEFEANSDRAADDWVKTIPLPVCFHSGFPRRAKVWPQSYI